MAAEGGHTTGCSPPRAAPSATPICHGFAGEGTPGHVPRLDGFVGLFTQVPGGRDYLMRVPGVASSVLDDARLAAVLNWMLATYGAGQVGASFPPYSPEEVSLARRQLLPDRKSIREQLLAAMRARGLLDRALRVEALDGGEARAAPDLHGFAEVLRRVGALAQEDVGAQARQHLEAIQARQPHVQHRQDLCFGDAPVQARQHVRPVDLPTVMKPLAADFFDRCAVFLAQMQFGLAHEHTSACQVATCEVYSCSFIYVLLY